MFLRCKVRRKDGKQHRYWSVVENTRVAGGRVVQRHVLYLGEINDTQELAWRRSIEVLEDGAAQPRTLSLFLIRDADVIAQNAGTLGDRKPGLRVDPPRQEVGDPAVRVRVARRTDIRPHATGRAVAADHVEELMRREMRQFVETDQCDLSALPVVDGGFKLQVRKLDLAGAWPAPLAHTEVRGPADPWIEV